MTHPIVFTRNPDAVLYDADLGDAAWEAKTGINALSTQATFDLPVSGETANGLRISLSRGTFQAEAANDVRVVVAVDITLSAAAAAYVAATRTLTITYSAASQAFTAVKTAVDAISGITSAYYGNATGADIGSVTSGAVRRRTHELVLCPGDGRYGPADQNGYLHPGERGRRHGARRHRGTSVGGPHSTGREVLLQTPRRHGRHRLRRNVAHEPGRIPHVSRGLTQWPRSQPIGRGSALASGSLLVLSAYSCLAWQIGGRENKDKRTWNGKSYF